jgi:hypothetical protein
LTSANVRPASRRRPLGKYGRSSRSSLSPMLAVARALAGTGHDT